MISVTLVLLCVTVAKTLPASSLIVSVFVNVSAGPDPPQHPATPHSPFCTSILELSVMPLFNMGCVILSDVKPKS